MSMFTREPFGINPSPGSQKPKSRGKMKHPYSVREPYVRAKKVPASGNLPKNGIKTLGNK